MRCNNCGYPNAATSLKCEKCNYPLDGSLNLDNSKSDKFSSEPENLSATIKGKESTAPPLDGDVSQPTDKTKDIVSRSPWDDPIKENKADMIREKQKKATFTGTIDPSRTPDNASFSTYASLQRINREGEPEDFLIPLEEEQVALSRDNTDQGNNSITSKTQALISHEGENYYIIDKSSLQTTFIVCKKKYKLEDGDIIMLGNRKFIFKS